MSIFLLAEYTAIGSLFRDYVGTSSLPITLFMGVLTIAYTTYGGLWVSILTDRAQVIESIFSRCENVMTLSVMFNKTKTKKSAHSLYFF